MGVFNLFKRGFDPEEFDKELNQVNDSITTTQEQLFRLNKSKKVLKKTIVRYLLLTYLVINIVIYTRIPNEIQGKNKVQRFFKGQSGYQLVFFFLYPTFVYVLIRLFDVVFGMLINKRKDRLKKLQKKQKEKLDELKRITNFNTTNALLKKYEVEDSNHSQKASIAPMQKPEGQVLTQRNGTQPTNGANKPNTVNKPADMGGVSAPKSKAEPPTTDYGKRTIQDRLLDLIIGSENDESIESRYALICYNCLAHNGLAPPGCKDPLDIKYLCMKCGSLNGKIEQTETKRADIREKTPDNINGIANEIISNDTITNSSSQVNSDE